MKRIPVFALLLGLAAPASATLLADWDLDDLAARADVVAIGTIEDQRYVRQGGLFLTESDVRVEQILRGDAAAILTVSQLGGRDGDIVADVVGTAELLPGERMLLFTYRHADGRRYLVGMALGAFFVREGGLLTRRVDVPLFGPDGALRRPPGRQALALSEVLAALDHAPFGSTAPGAPFPAEVRP